MSSTNEGLKKLATGLTLGGFLAVAVFLSVPSAALAQAGVPLWTNRYNGPDNHSDSARVLVVDKTGQIYVAGAARIGGQRVTQTIKYASSGLPLWTNRFGEIPGGGFDIALGSGGQGVYVFGVSEPFFSQPHYFVIAYSADGAALWTNRYSVPSDIIAFLRPAGIASDVSSGNVYLTGAMAISQACDIFTIAYSPSGTPLWTNFFGSSPQILTTDIPTAIGVGSNGNIYVGGNSTRNWVTVAYTPTGEALWTNSFDSEMDGLDWVSDLAVANNGDAVLAGAADSDNQVAIIRYSSAGVPLWTNLFEVGSVEIPPKVVVADDGKIYSTWGWEDDYVTVALTSNGAPVWTNLYGGPDVAEDDPSGLTVDAQNNVYVMGSSDNDWTIIAYSVAGTALWTNRFGADDREDYANGIAVSHNGEVYVAGELFAPNGYSDWAIVKYAGISPSPIQLEVRKAGNQVALSWADARFALQSAPTVTGTFTNIPGAVSPFTNSVTGAQRFFRLKAN